MSSKYPNSKDGKQHTGPNRSGGPHDRRDVSGSIHVRGEIETKIPQDIAEKRDAAEEKKESRDKRRFVVEILSLVFVVIYAILTGVLVYFANGQLEEARIVTRATDANFRAGERAWVMVDTLTLNHDFSTTESTGMKFVIKNFGQSPALRVSSHTDAVFAGQECTTNMTTQRSPYSSTDDIAPNQISSYLNFGVGSLSQECLDALHSGRASYKIRGIIQYEDIFRVPHTTEFCAQYEGLSSRQMSACPDGNRIN